MTRRFNLQPWRAELRAAKNKQFTNVTVAVVGIALLCCALYAWRMTSYLNAQVEANEFLQSEIKKLEPAKKEVDTVKALNDEILKQIRVINDLQLDRGLTVRMFSHLAENIPETVFLNSANYNSGKNTLVLNGTAENELGVSAFIRELKKFENFTDIKVAGVYEAQNTGRYTVADRTPVRTFTLNITVARNSELIESKE